jgi:glycosyltransferase involved in cell wall biosynthesis
MLLAIHFARLGPYHLARLRSACEILEPLGWRVLALEIAGSDETYDWERESGGVGEWERVTVFPDGVFEKISASEMKRGIQRELDRLQPDAVAIAGWGTLDARACLDWCKRNHAKAIVMSETRAADGRRIWWKEWVKSRIVRRFDAALCGGESHKRYLVQLGMPEERIAYGYNVVDNAFFAERPASAGESGGERADKQKTLDAGCLELDSSLPMGPYFLASNRFVERKNLGRLLEGYKIFQDSALQIQGAEKRCVWPLVLLGDGELRRQLEAQCVELGLKAFSFQGSEFSDAEGDEGAESKNSKLNPYKLKTTAGAGCVVFAGFRQIGELRAFYAAAGAFVHPALEEPWGLVINEAMASGLPVLSSCNVGAAEELVVEGKTGFLFDPGDVNSIAESLFKMFSMSEAERQKMGAAAREMLECKVPSRAFGEGLAKVLVT